MPAISIKISTKPISIRMETKYRHCMTSILMWQKVNSSAS